MGFGGERGSPNRFAVWEPYVVVDMFASRESTFLDRAIKQTIDAVDIDINP
jgi:hypothetical protein